MLLAVLIVLAAVAEALFGAPGGDQVVAFLPIPLIAAGAGALLGGLTSGDKTSTQSTQFDPATQAYINRIRQAGIQGASDVQGAGPFFLGPDDRSIEAQIAPFFNPYIQNVIGGVRGEFDALRANASRDTNLAAAGAGALNSSRAQIANQVRQAQLDRAQTSQIGGLLSTGFQNALTQGLAFSEYQRALRERQAQEPLFRAQNRLNFLTGGLGPLSSTTTTTQPGNRFAGAVGGALTGLGATGYFNPGQGPISAPTFGYQSAPAQGLVTNPLPTAQGYPITVPPVAPIYG